MKVCIYFALFFFCTFRCYAQSEQINSGTYSFSVAASAMHYRSGDVGVTDPIAFTSIYTGMDGNIHNAIGSTIAVNTWNNMSNQLGSSGVTIIFDLESPHYVDRVITSHGLPSYYGVGTVTCSYSVDGVVYYPAGSDGQNEKGPSSTTTREISFDRVIARYIRLDVASVSWYSLRIDRVVIEGNSLDTSFSALYKFSIPAASMRYWSGDVGNKVAFAYQMQTVGDAGDLNSVLGSSQGVVTWNNGNNELGGTGVEVVFDFFAPIRLESITSYHTLPEYFGVGAVEFLYSLDGINYTSLGTVGSNQNGPLPQLLRTMTASGDLAKYVKLKIHSVAWRHLQIDRVVFNGKMIPWIELQGVTGAEKWAWVEAEKALIATNSAVPMFKDTTAISNHSNNPDCIRDRWVSGGGWSEYGLLAPGDFDSLRLFWRYGIDRQAAPSSIYLDGVQSGGFSHSVIGNYDLPVNLRSDDYVPLGSVSKGFHQLRVEHPSAYADRSYDGFFIYEGNNAVFNNSTISFGKDEWGPYYLQHPSSSNGPTVGSWIKPKAIFHGRDNYQEFEAFLIKDGGIPQHFRLGDVIKEPGEYELVVYMAEKQWRVSAYAGANFKIIPAAAGTQFPDDDPVENIPENNFPLGWYHTIATWDLPQMDLNIFNTVAPYGARWGYHNVAHELGLGIYQYPQGTGQNFQSFVAEYKSSPAITAWNIYDEPVDQGVGISDFRDMCDDVKFEDPSRPITAVFALADTRVDPYLAELDFAMLDRYPVKQDDPVPSPNLFQVAKATSYIAAKSASLGLDPPIFVSQAFGGYGNPIRREPTEFECRYMTFAPITVGARGIIYYSLFDASKTMVTTVNSVASELKNLVPVILSQNSFASVSSNKDSDTSGHGVNDVTYLFKMRSESSELVYYLISVNNKGFAMSSVNFTISNLPSGSYSAEVMGENRTISLGGTGPYVLADDFDNYDVHIYRITMN